MIAVSLKEGEDIVKLLLSKGADVSETSKSTRSTSSRWKEHRLTVIQITTARSVDKQPSPWFRS
jgi:hypothetical protein